MDAATRRKQIKELLQLSSAPISATTLAKQLGVSRQVIVGDVALLRSAGVDISATPKGYLLHRKERGLLYTVACRHDSHGMEQELCIMVDNGCIVLDVIVEHPIYGQLTGPLNLASRYDVQQFIARTQAFSASPLSLLTEGVHLHTLSCPDENAFQRVCMQLRTLDILIED